MCMYIPRGSEKKITTYIHVFMHRFVVIMTTIITTQYSYLHLFSSVLSESLSVSPYCVLFMNIAFLCMSIFCSCLLLHF